MACLKKPLDKVDASVAFLKNAPASKQIKYAALRSLQFSSIYLMSCLPNSPVTNKILEGIEQKYLDFIYALFDIPLQYRDQNYQVRIQSPIEDGGLGLLPLAFLRPHLFENNEFEANTIRRCLKFAELPGKKSCELKMIWKTFPPKQNKEVSYHQGSFLSAWPSKPLLVLDDDTFHFGVNHRLGLMRPFPFHCLHTLQDLGSLPQHEFISHFESCSSCGTAMWWQRHERVNNVLCKTFKYHNISCELNPLDYNLPGNERGGPDFLLFVGSQIFAGDVMVTSRTSQEGFRYKTRKYKAFADATTHELFPFVMTTRRKVDYGTFLLLQKIQEQCTSKHLVNDIISHAQIEMLKGMYCGFLKQKAKHVLRTMKEANTDTPLLIDANTPSHSQIHLPENDLSEPRTKRNREPHAPSATQE